MSSLRWADHFERHGYESWMICRPGTRIHERAQDRRHYTLNPFNYFSPMASLYLKSFIIHKNIRAIFLHQLKDLWILYPAIKHLPEVQVFGFARMFLRGINKKDFFHRRLYRRLNRLILLSERQKETLFDCLPVTSEQCVVIPNGIDLGRFQPGTSSFREEGHWDADEVLIALVGRIDRQKGQKEMIEAMALLKQKGIHARTVIVGKAKFPDLEEELKTLAKNKGVEDRVMFAGHRSDIPQILQACDFLVMPSYEEAFGNVLLEAMATGKPCIATDAGGAPEILGDCGLLVKPRSAESLAEQLEKMILDSDLRKNLGEASLRRVQEHYSQEKVFARVEQLL